MVADEQRRAVVEELDGPRSGLAGVAAARCSVIARAERMRRRARRCLPAGVPRPDVEVRLGDRARRRATRRSSRGSRRRASPMSHGEIEVLGPELSAVEGWSGVRSRAARAAASSPSAYQSPSARAASSVDRRGHVGMRRAVAGLYTSVGAPSGNADELRRRRASVEIATRRVEPGRSCTSSVPSTRTRSPSPNSGVPNPPRRRRRRPMWPSAR